MSTLMIWIVAHYLLYAQKQKSDKTSQRQLVFRPPFIPMRHLLSLAQINKHFKITNYGLLVDSLLCICQCKCIKKTETNGVQKYRLML